MTTANKITIVRMALVPVFMASLLYDFPYCEILGIIIFAAAAATDFVDGYIARRYNQITNFGKLIDPLADKLLVTAALIGFVWTDALNPWFAFIIITREFIVMGLRLIAVSNGKVLAADMSGKVKTVLQIAAILAMLTDRITVLAFAGISLSFVLMLAAVAATLYSGVEYIVKNRGMIEFN